MEKQKKKGKVSAVLSGIGFVLLGMIFGFCFAALRDMVLGKAESNALYFLFLIPAFVFCFLIQIILHELGHLIFGLLTGYRFSSFRVFNLMWVKIDNKFYFKRLSLAGTGGQCLMLPPPLTDGKMPTFWYNLGGAIFNIFTSVLSFALMFLCKNLPYLALFLFVFGSMGLILGLSNGIPMSVGKIDNDGKNALSLRKNEQATYAFWLQLKVTGVLASGTRLKDMPTEWFVLPSKEAMTNSLIAVRGVFTENYYMASYRFSEAKEVGELLLSSECATDGINANLLRCDLTYIALAIDGDKEKAKSLWTKKLIAFQKTMKNFPTVLRVQYTYALLFEDDESKAQEILNRFEKVAKRYPYAADIDSERELITIAQEKKKQTSLLEMKEGE